MTVVASGSRSPASRRSSRRSTSRSTCPGVGTITVDVAYGGCFYVLVDGAALGVRLTREQARDVVERAEAGDGGGRAAARRAAPGDPRDRLPLLRHGDRRRRPRRRAACAGRRCSAAGSTARRAGPAPRPAWPAWPPAARRRSGPASSPPRSSTASSSSRSAARRRSVAGPPCAQHLRSRLDLRHQDDGRRSDRSVPDRLRAERPVGPPSRPG